ncbi:MAG: DUF5110 domain-containing protein [Bacteroidales bacterium]|nr:DUF5110 domain-containing protein [Bacteroidales bacterium]MCF8389883.1 DUF5110 domain-containing protein [Bacteroidales bacterium]
MRNLFLIVIFVTLSCSISSKEDNRNSENRYQFIDNLISIEAENFSACHGWSVKNFYTGVGISPDKNSNSDSSFVQYNLNIEKGGIYSFFFLGSLNRNNTATDNIFTISLVNEDTKDQINEYLALPPSNTLIWSSLSFPEKQKVKLTIENSGRYILKISDSEGGNYYLDKFVLALDSSYFPSGTGPVQTLNIDSQFPRNDIVIPPSWAFGVLYGGYTDQQESLSVIDSLTKGDYPIDAFWIDSYFWDFNSGKGPKGYIDFIGDTMAFPDVEYMWSKFEEKKIKAGIWVWNMINEKGNEEVFETFKTKNYFSDISDNKNSWHNASKDTRTGSIDFSNPEAASYWQKCLEPFFTKGLDFLKLDNSSDIPYCEAAFSATGEMGKETEGRGFILAHVHSTYDYRHKQYPAKWTGDAKICWSQPDYPNMEVYAMGGLKENIAMIADPKRTTYEIPFLTHDAGGYDYFGSTEQSDELYMRWIQFASMNTMMTIFSTAKNPTRNHPYRYPIGVRDNFKKYTHLRMQLFPYIYSYALNTHLTGKKMVQGDGVHEQQYLFGNELLVAPVYQKGITRQEVYFPEGEWYDFDTDELYQGNQTLSIDAPVEKLPLFVKKGAILPMRHYARAIELGNNDTLVVHVYPSEVKTIFSLYEDDGISNDYLQGIYATTKMSVIMKENKLEFTIEPVVGNYSGMNPNRSYQLKFHNISTPKTASVNGKMILETGNNESFNYLDSKKILTVFFGSVKSEESKINISY